MPLNAVDRTNLINQSSINNNRPGANVNVATKETYGDGDITVSAKNLGLSAGQTFSGQVVDVNGNDIKLLLNNNQTISAKLDGNLNAVLGQVISFEVSSTDGGTTALRPLYTNLSNMTAISNALQSAGLPETSQYVKMVSAMMDESMPINKEALWSMSKDVNIFQDANPATIVQMAKLSLPINELTINQLENYKNFEYQIKDDVSNLSKGIVDLMDEALKEANPEFYESIALAESESATKQQSPVNNLFSAFLNAVSGNSDNSKSIDQNLQNSEADVIENKLDGDEAIISEEENTTGVSKESFSSDGLKLAGQVIDLVDTNSDASKVAVSDKLNTILNEIIDEATRPAETVDSEKTDEDIQKSAVDNGQSAEQIQNEESSEKSNSLRSFTFSEAVNLAKGIITYVNRNPESVPTELKKSLSELLSDNEFKGTLKDVLSKQLTLKPEDVTGNDKIEELYGKILKQTQAAVEIMNNAGKDNPDISKAAQNLNDNVNFMNQLNQAVTYIQLPLLMNNQSAHGDLYVYTNKKNLKNNDGNLSALLHLDMENLGPMDVYVALTNGTKVNTHFYLQDEATIDFIAEHIDKLNERLTKKGYNMSTNISVSGKDDKPTNIAEEFMKEAPEQTSRIAAKYSFDVRA